MLIKRLLETRWYATGRIVLIVAPWLLALSVSCGSEPTPTISSVATVQSTATPVPSTLEVPIEVRGALNVGGLQLELIYDPEVLELQEVRAGPLARNALLESNSETPGRLKIALVDASGINGDGAVITVIFLPTGREGSSSLTLGNVEASDTDLRDLVVQTTSTKFIDMGDPLDPLILSFAR